METSPARTAVLYGFRINDPDTTGYVRITESGRPEAVEDRADATRFETENVSNRKGWGSPEQWCGYFNDDEDLRGWKFHVVRLCEETK